MSNRTSQERPASAERRPRLGVTARLLGAYQSLEQRLGPAIDKLERTDSFATVIGRLLETMLLLQKHGRANVQRLQELWNVPTREDLARLGELVVGLEEKVDQLDDRLQRIEDRLEQLAATRQGEPASRP